MTLKEVVISADPGLYRETISRLPDFAGSIFYDPDFLELAAAALGLKPRPLVISKGDTILGIVNLTTKERPGVISCTIPHHFQYFGPAIFQQSNLAWQAFVSYLGDNCDLAVFSLLPELDTFSFDTSWSCRKRLTYRIETDSYENMKSRCADDVKNKLNKANRSNIAIEQIDYFPEQIYLSSFERHRLKPPVPPPQMSDWLVKLKNLGLAQIYLARVDGQPAAFRVQLIRGAYAYDWLAGSYESYHHLGVNQYLMLRIGETHYQNGVRLWDLCGGDVRSVGEFKKSFGSMPVNHIEAERAFGIKGKIYRFLMRLRRTESD